MERIPESKPLPRQQPIEPEHLNSVREVGNQLNVRSAYDLKSKPLPRQLPFELEVANTHLNFVREVENHLNVQNAHDLKSKPLPRQLPFELEETNTHLNFVREVENHLNVQNAHVLKSKPLPRQLPFELEETDTHLNFVREVENHLNVQNAHDLKSKSLPRQLPFELEVTNTHLNFVREVGNQLNVQNAHDLKSKPFPRQLPFELEMTNTHLNFVREVGNQLNVQNAHDLKSYASVRTWKGKNNLLEKEEVMPDVLSLKSSVDSFEEVGSTSFHGVSHPPEPVDTDLMRPVCVPIGQNKADGKCLVKNLSVKGPFIEDLSIRVPGIKPSISLLSPAESLEPNDLGIVSSPFAVPRPSQNTEVSLPPDSEEKECIWDASLPPSGNVSPLSSIDSAGVVTAMSIVNSCTSTYRSDGIMSDGMLSVDRNYESTKASMRGDSLESAKTSLSRASDSSGLSDESNWSNITGSANKPHKGNDPRWKAILAIRARDGILGMSHFKLLRRLGCGDIGSVYLSELSATRCFFAMKVMDKASLASRKKLTRAQTEREILQLLDHPFLPTLYTHFETDRFSCLVMEYCPGGDLHTLRQRQPGKHFSEYAARFYAAEVLLALEYLHMLGVVYRDLKPENVLVRDDGHIMLSDFDLSLRCAVSPTLIRNSDSDPSKRGAAFCVQPACIEPTSVCIQPACFIPRLFQQKSKKKSPKPRGEPALPAGMLPELVAEPTSARSMSFVGTHEYLAPEIIKGEGHGSAVDWWTFGIFLHELLYGKTPFKGSGNRATLFNVVGQQLRFPDSPATSYASRDLIRGLLVKEPQHRLGTKRGATEIKQHPFFEGVNWALIRCSTPPEVPRPVEAEFPAKFGQVDAVGVGSSSKRILGTDMKSGGKFLDFEFF